MNARFYRDEAFRFRGMAEDAGREATKLRLLGIAADYEARAALDSPVPEANSGEEAKATAEPSSGEATAEAPVAAETEVPKLNLRGKITTGMKETVLIQRRPGRPRRE